MHKLPNLTQLWNGFTHLLFPRLCVACGWELPLHSSCFCLKCQLRLRPSDMHLAMENEFVQRLWGRLPLVSGAAAYYFSARNPVRKAIHLLKYKNSPDIGLILGRDYGKKLIQTAHFRTVQAVIPVPLHPKKERLRGYNQSALIAQGIAESMQIPLLEKNLIRKTHTKTQTGKKRMERFDNVDQVFQVVEAEALQNKHILLVDDVLTTGATLEGAGKILLQTKGTRLSCATIGIAGF